MPLSPGRRHAPPRGPRRLLALLAVPILLAAQLLVAAAASAQALPKGAYWYQLLDLPKAWHTNEGAGVTVAVIDQGVQADLGDLQGQVLPGLDLTGRDPRGQRDDAEPDTGGFGHGSDMAALIAGTGRGAGLIGVAPEAKILPVDASTNGTYDIADVARGISWAADHGAEVINLSLGRHGSCPTVLAQAIRHAYDRDVIVVAAAGEPAGPVSAPANCPGALAISAVDSAIKPWTKTASGPEVAFAAPGYGLVNELLTNKLYGPDPLNSGTSQAAAIASGTFALLRAEFPSESARQIVTRALYNTHNGLGEKYFGTRADDYLGYGMILPRYALTDPLPANARNPIYDQWAKDFARSGSVAPATPSSSAPSSSAPPAGSGSASQSPTVTASADGGGGLSPVLIAVLVVVVLGAVAIAILRVRRRGAIPPGYGR
ncbi:S8 family serine peptidase [uncultured Jatrophihabitans sp.]|uniref:S8 family serine peptidase n=1 Tax=uncultured Jatrophihabitans sp. TaxID=1610747 RepID=UPI0035CC6D99